MAVGELHLLRVPLALRVCLPGAARDNRVVVTSRLPGLDLPRPVRVLLVEAEAEDVERADVTVVVLIVLVVRTANDLDRAAVVVVTAGGRGTAGGATGCAAGRTSCRAGRRSRRTARGTTGAGAAASPAVDAEVARPVACRHVLVGVHHVVSVSERRDRRARPVSIGVGGPRSARLCRGGPHQFDVPSPGLAGFPAQASDEERADRISSPADLDDANARVGPSRSWICACGREEKKRDAHEDREVSRCLAHTRLRILSRKLGSASMRGSLLARKAGVAPPIGSGVTNLRWRRTDRVTDSRRFGRQSMKTTEHHGLRVDRATSERRLRLG